MATALGIARQIALFIKKQGLEAEARVLSRSKESARVRVYYRAPLGYMPPGFPDRKTSQRQRGIRGGIGTIEVQRGTRSADHETTVVTTRGGEWFGVWGERDEEDEFKEMFDELMKLIVK